MLGYSGRVTACICFSVSLACFWPGPLASGADTTITTATTAPSRTLPSNYRELSQSDFAALCDSWTTGISGTALLERKKLASYAWTAYLNDPQKAGALSGDDFITISTLTASSLAKNEVDTLRQIVLRKFPAAADVQPLSVKSLDRLTTILAAHLGFTSEQTSAWLGSWVDGKNGGGALSLEDQAAVWDLGVRLHMPVTSLALQSLGQNMWDKYLKVKEAWDGVPDEAVMADYNRLYSALPRSQRSDLSKNVWRRLNLNVPQMATKLVMRDFRRMKDEIVPAANIKMKDLLPLLSSFVTTRGDNCTLNDLSYGVYLSAFYRHDPALEGTVATIYQTVARNTLSKLGMNVAVEDFDHFQPPLLGKVFETDSDRQQLRTLLGAAVLENRLAAGQILTWSYMTAGKLSDWKTEVDAKAADDQGGADTKAYWLLISGEIEVATYTQSKADHEPDVKRKRQAMDKALGTAQSEGMKFLVLEEFTDYFTAVRRPSMGTSLLTSVSGQFTPDTARKIKGLQKILQTRQNFQDTKFKAAQAAAQKHLQESQLKDYQASLGRARIDGNQDAAAKLEAAINELKAKMQQAPN